MNTPPIRFRAVLLGLFFTILICAATPFNNAYRQATPLGGGHFPLAPFFIFVWLTLFMAFWGKLTSWMKLKFRNDPFHPSGPSDRSNISTTPDRPYPPSPDATTYAKRDAKTAEKANEKREPGLFTGKELLLAWIEMLIGSGIAYTGLARTFFFNLTVPFRFSTMENRWDEVLQPLLPKALYPQDMDAITLLYTGLEKGHEMSWLDVLQKIPWHSWLLPLFTWGGFIFLCYFVMLCVINILSRQWIHNENMNFPLLRVPQMLSDAMEQQAIFSFFANGFLICGMLVPIFLHTLNGFHFYFPSVPQIPTLVLAGPYFPEYGIFSGFHKLKIYFYPAFIGFAFITARQISFSFWFMFIVCALLTGLLTIMGYNIPASALGVTFGPTLTLPVETQMIGAYGIFFLSLIWLSRAHLGGIFKSLFLLKSQPQQDDQNDGATNPHHDTHRFPTNENRTKTIDLGKGDGEGVNRPHSDNAVSHPEWVQPSLSLWGALLGWVAIILWLFYFGMSLKVSVLLVGAFFMILVVSSRIVAQGGVAYFTITAAPIDGMLAFFGPGFFTASSILMAGVVQKMLFVDMREALMPSLLQAAKVHEAVKTKRMILTGIVLTLILSVAVSFTAMLALCHKYGLREIDMEWAARTTLTVYDNIFKLIENPVTSDHWILIFSLVGAVVMFILIFCYQRFYWWPLHPLGYLTAYSSAMKILWFSFFIGWLFNALCVRYGGVAFFKKIRLFFIGLIIGDFLMGGVWAVTGFFMDSSYQVLPN